MRDRDANNQHERQSGPSRRPSGGWLGLLIAVVIFVVVAGVVVVQRRHHGSPAEHAPEGAALQQEATILAILSAGGPSSNAALLCQGSTDHCVPAHRGDKVPLGSQLRVADTARVVVSLGADAKMSLDRGTRISLDARKRPSVHVLSGLVRVQVAAGAHRPIPVVLKNTTVNVPAGEMVAEAGEPAIVHVKAGHVVLARTEAPGLTLTSGQTCLIETGKPLRASWDSSHEPSFSHHEADTDREKPAGSLAGVGQLRARRPGRKSEPTRALRLAKHSVHVRVVGPMARTEVDETFANESDVELEGTYEFHVPSGAQVEGLELEVDGKLQRGAFVSRERATKIWRGVMHAAAPKLVSARNIIWAPGPWKDPALLEWKHGGALKLRIFPIPAHGTRRVVISYTHMVPLRAGRRQYIYHLGFDATGASRIDQFHVDVQVTGADAKAGVRAVGYEMKRSDVEGERVQLSLDRAHFVPAGDLVVRYATRSDKREMSSWVTTASAADLSAIEASVSSGSEKSFVALTIRPRIPERRQSGPQALVLAVDSSRSMFGERYREAVRVVSTVVSEMSPDDRFVAMACDESCQIMDGSWQSPTEDALKRVRSFFKNIVPDGASNMAAPVEALAKLHLNQNGSPRLWWISDGVPTSGAVNHGQLVDILGQKLRGLHVQMNAVALGGSADVHVLQTMTKVGAGVMIRVLPGTTSRDAALRILDEGHRQLLTNVRLDAPFLTDVHPRDLSNLMVGDELVVVGLAPAGDVRGDVLLTAEQGREQFRRTYHVQLGGHEGGERRQGFAGRLYGQFAIADLLARGATAEVKRHVIAMSKRFALPSPYTSMLVLESPAMFHAFGVEHGRSADRWAGLWDAKSVDVDAEEDERSPETRGTSSSASLGPLGGGATGGARRKPSKRAVSKSSAVPTSTPAQAGRALGDDRGLTESPTRRRDKALARPSGWTRPRPAPRAVWVKSAFVSVKTDAFAKRWEERERKAHEAWQAAPNERRKLAHWVALLLLRGRLKQAQGAVARWERRDPLDPELLELRAQVAARLGHRREAMRILSGLAEIDPGRVPLQRRLARMFEGAHKPMFACAHRIALAGLHDELKKDVLKAKRCRNLLAEVAGRTDGGQGGSENRADFQMPKGGGEVQVRLLWDGDDVLDVAVIDGRGRRLSCLSDEKNISFCSVGKAGAREQLNLRWIPRGNYLIEVTRADGIEGREVRGKVVIVAPSLHRTVPFVLSGARKPVAVLRVQLRRQFRWARPMRR